jgi:NTP pyrophosphatase (non-canonical NTP hydrolase)
MQDLATEIKHYLDERGWNQLKPGDIAKSITIEAAELLELFQWSNPDLETVQQDAQLMSELKKEVADVMIYAMELGVLLNFNIEEAIREKLEHIKKKYPAEVMKQDDKASGSHSAYLQIKKAYRTTI